MQIFFNFLEILIVVVPTLLSVAFMTIIERKVIASIQRRIGPNVVGYYGVLQPFADALKLVVKEQIIPSQAQKGLFFLSPMVTLVFSLLGWAVIPFGQGLCLTDFSLGVLYSLILSSIGVYGILFAGWSANSKYAFLGALRRTAQIISYELVYSSAVLCIIFLCGTFNISIIIERQESIWYIIPVLPIFVLFFVSALAETNRTPFDFPEAESELVAGFITEHSGIIFVFFFLAEYCSIVLISTFTAILFLGGYQFPEIFINDTIINMQSLILGIKSLIFIFIFVWIRATLPRLRYDRLIVFCWTSILPIAIGLLFLVPSVLVAFGITANTPFYTCAFSNNLETVIYQRFFNNQETFIQNIFLPLAIVPNKASPDELQKEAMKIVENKEKPSLEAINKIAITPHGFTCLNEEEYCKLIQIKSSQKIQFFSNGSKKKSK